MPLTRARVAFVPQASTRGRLGASCVPTAILGSILLMMLVRLFITILLPSVSTALKVNTLHRPRPLVRTALREGIRMYILHPPNILLRLIVTSVILVHFPIVVPINAVLVKLGILNRLLLRPELTLPLDVISVLPERLLSCHPLRAPRVELALSLRPLVRRAARLVRLV